jgi:aminocarboxymuconate-semialdehyde decarboxylase
MPDVGRISPLNRIGLRMKTVGQNAPGHARGLSRRQLLGAASLAAAALFCKLPAFAAPQKKALCIDVHAHLWTDAYLDLVTSYGKTDTNIQRGRGAGPGDADIAKRFATMDAAGVNLQVLSVSPQMPHFADKAHAVNAARMANDMCADAVRRWPQRFAAFAALPLPHIDESLRELDRALGQLHMAGVANTTAILGRSVADASFTPIYEELNRRGTVLFLHPVGNNAATPFIADYHATWMVGAPVEDLIAVVQLILAGIPKRFPNVKIINSHLGGAVPTVLARWDSVSTWENPGVPERPSIAARRMWYDTVDYGDVPALRAAVDTLGAGQIVLGSDFPYESGKAYELCANYIRNAGLKPQDVARILDENASRLLGL